MLSEFTLPLLSIINKVSHFPNLNVSFWTDKMFSLLILQLMFDIVENDIKEQRKKT